MCTRRESETRATLVRRCEIENQTSDRQCVRVHRISAAAAVCAGRAALGLVSPARAGRVQGRFVCEKYDRTAFRV